jgi:hypothetical protein
MIVILCGLHHVVTKCSDNLAESTGWVRSNNSVANIVTGLRAELPGVQISVGTSSFLLSETSRPLWGQPSLCQIGTGGSISGDKADCSPHSNTEGQSMWRCTCFPPACLHGMERDNFTFFFSLPELVQHRPEPVHLPCRWKQHSGPEYQNI